MDLRALSFLPFKTSWVGKTHRGTWATQNALAESGLRTDVMVSQPVGLSAVGALGEKKKKERNYFDEHI